MSIIVFFAVLLLLGSAATNNAIDGVKGFQAPIFKVERTDSVVSLDDMRGHWVLLQFWSSSDARSRIAESNTLLLSRSLMMDSRQNDSISYRSIWTVVSASFVR